MANYVKALAADIDLIEIWSYISQRDFETADRFLDQLESAFEALAEHPMMGRSREELLPELRSLSVGAYIIFYRVKSNRVEIARVLNGARDVAAVFREP